MLRKYSKVYSGLKSHYPHTGKTIMLTDSTPKNSLTTHRFTIDEAPAEPDGTLSDPFPLPPFGLDRVSTPISPLRQTIVNTIQNYSMAVKVDAAREMIRRLEKGHCS